jgi:hypothetical protein
MADEQIHWDGLSSNEQAVLSGIANTDPDCWIGWTFKGIARLTKRPIEDVRSACRSLRAKGLARPERGLMTEDGDFVGSGYTATPEGDSLYWNSDAATAAPSPSDGRA